MKKKEYLEEIEREIKKGPYCDTWQSLCTHNTPKWYQDAKFGIFIHWGVFSVPAFGTEWYPRFMYLKGTKENLHHLKTYGPLNKFGYKDFIPMFKAEKFHPEEWASLFQEAGAKFVMPVAEHTDGFQMYDSDLSVWNAQNMGPHKDMVGLLKKSLEDRNLQFCTSSHRAEHWWFMNTGRAVDCDVMDPKYASFYGPAAGVTTDMNSILENPPDDEFMEDWLVRCCEIVDKYQPKIMFFDWWIQVLAFKPYLRKFAAYYYNRAQEWGCEVAIDAKFDAFVHGSCTQDLERGQLAGITKNFWQNDTSVAKNSWGYSVGNDYKTPESIICDLVDIVSKNGALLLNIGPKSDGTIPEEDTQILKEIGRWLKVNGEAIYYSQCWKIFGEGPTTVPEGSKTDTDRQAFTSEDIRFTCKADIIYAIAMKWNNSGKFTIKALAHKSPYFHSRILSARILGETSPVTFKQTDEALEIYSNHITTDDKPVVIKVTID